MVVIAPAIVNSYFSAPVDFPVIDMHVQMTRNFTIEKILEIAGRTGI
jgi:hypothetical protein